MCFCGVCAFKRVCVFMLVCVRVGVCVRLRGGGVFVCVKGVSECVFLCKRS